MRMNGRCIDDSVIARYGGSGRFLAVVVRVGKRRRHDCQGGRQGRRFKPALLLLKLLLLRLTISMEATRISGEPKGGAPTLPVFSPILGLFQSEHIGQSTTQSSCEFKLHVMAAYSAALKFYTADPPARAFVDSQHRSFSAR